MEELFFKIRLTALWILAMIAFFVYRTIAISQGVTEVSVLSNRELVTVLLIMMLFALLTLLLPYKVSRSVNFVAGIVFAILKLIMLGDGLTAYTTAVFNMMTGAFIISRGRLSDSPGAGKKRKNKHSIFTSTIISVIYKKPKAAAAEATQQRPC